MTQYILDENTKWKYLPWKQIQQRVLVLKNTIYKASQVCNKQIIYKRQNNLINSNEAKIIAVEHICRSIKHLYINYNKESYIISDLYKTYLVSVLFNYKKMHKIKIYKSFQFLIQRIEQYMIYLCLESEWNIRFRSMFNLRIHNSISFILNQKDMNNNFYSISYNYYMPSKYINYSYIKKK
uniref:hypothetical protein n=1 Tax=Gracilaria urvillei TaxID=172974 RepID=UPI001D10211C|nr:hypothetical protein LK147_pgp122 [Hydropuntia urvillei]UAD88418.1 hypothetical protein [Hydropuntia urvillei]